MTPYLALLLAAPVPSLIHAQGLINPIEMMAGPFSTTSPSADRNVAPAERQALVDLYKATGGNNWNRNDNWGRGDPCRNRWVGVHCSLDARGRPTVERLELVANGMVGELPLFLDYAALERTFGRDQIRAIIRLRESLTESVVYEHIRPYLKVPPPTALPNLRELSLGRNRLRGKIPATLALMENLQYLMLDENEFEGEIPAGLSELRQLRILALQNNHLTGPLKRELAKLEHLDVLLVSGNELGGTVPNEYGRLWRLRELALQGNAFDKALPNWLLARFPRQAAAVRRGIVRE